MTRRLHDWQLRLEACIAERWARPFEWGVHDCTLFAADCVLAVTGVDHAADFRGKYTTEIGARKLLLRAGGLEAIAIGSLGAEIHPALAQAGDVGMAFETEQPILCVWGGAHWIGAGLEGLQPVVGVQRAWRCC